MEAVDSWLMEDWNGTDCGNFFVGSRCRMSVSEDLCLDDEESWLDGWIDFRVDRCGPLRICEGRLCSKSVEPTSQMWDVRPVHVWSLLRSDGHEKENVLHNDRMLNCPWRKVCVAMLTMKSKFQFVAIRFDPVVSCPASVVIRLVCVDRRWISALLSDGNAVLISGLFNHMWLPPCRSVGSFHHM